jgi:hypothetical protein
VMGKKEEDKPFKCQCVRCGGAVQTVACALDAYKAALVAQRADWVEYVGLCAAASGHSLGSPEHRKLDGRAGAMSKRRGENTDRVRHAREALDAAILAEAVAMAATAGAA